MTLNDAIQLLIFAVVLTALAKPLGAYMARVYEGRPFGLDKALGWLERLVYRLCGVDARVEMGWKLYALAMLLFNLAGLLLVYLLQRAQGALPLNPQGFGAVSPDSSFNTAVSFASNTNWQGYGGESTMSYLTQMLGLTVQNFVSAATGMAVLVALIRGFARRSASTIGNFWVDLTRTTLYILLPLSIVWRLVLVSQGVVQTFGRLSQGQRGATHAVRGAGDGQGRQARTRRHGPAEDEEVDAHRANHRGRTGGLADRHQAARDQRRRLLQCQLRAPVREPDAAVQLPRGARHPAHPRRALLHVRRHGGRHAPGVGGAGRHDASSSWRCSRCAWRPSSAAPRSPAGRRSGGDRAVQSGGNMEGKEVRFGIANSALWATATTAASNGSVNSMHDSYTPLGGMVPMWLMQLGEVVFGGVGSGLYGMLIFAIVAVFVAGLMVGRTPEYLGKKIEAFEMKMASLVILIVPAARPGRHRRRRW